MGLKATQRSKQINYIKIYTENITNIMHYIKYIHLLRPGICKTNTKYFRFCKAHGICHTYSTLP